jgi:soluble lytic murein transglycosylase
MFCRFFAAAVILLTATLPASALNTRPLDDALTSAAARMKVKDYAAARQAALKSSEKGARAFLLGMSDVRLELWDDAASQLALAAESYPVLADYALYNEGLALSKLGRPDQALPPLYKLLRQCPESRLARPAMLLYGDTMAAGGHAKEALGTYTAFIERYPSGSDSISALFGSALCREKLGDPAGAASVLRGIWLNTPASPCAQKAAAELQALSAAGTKADPYTQAELFKRGCTLYDLRHYGAAAGALAAIQLDGANDDFATKVRLKIGEAQYRTRRYQDAQATLRWVIQKSQAGATASEARLWLGRALSKSGKSDEAYNLYLRLADEPKGSFADDGLLEAAYLKRFQRKWGEALRLFQRFLASYPDKGGSVAWEAAWASYESHDYQGAAWYLRKLVDRDGMREKALYWLGKSLAASGDAKGADASFAALATEYPFGYYTLLCNRWCDVAQFPTPPKNLADALPMPSGFEREKALIMLGLYDEASRELAAKRTRNALGVARLYLEMGNYNGALHAAAKDKPKRSENTAWGINYPLAFREEVAKHASANLVPQSLVYAIMRTESNYSPSALSPVGAVGLMQIMPATAEAISKGGSAKLARPDLNIRLGSKHLRDLMSMYGKNFSLTAAAYNAGSGNVKRWQRDLGGLPLDEFVESIPYHETREYVKKVVTAMELYQRLYRLPPYKN